MSTMEWRYAGGGLRNMASPGAATKTLNSDAELSLITEIRKLQKLHQKYFLGITESSKHINVSKY